MRARVCAARNVFILAGASYKKYSLEQAVQRRTHARRLFVMRAVTHDRLPSLASVRPAGVFAFIAHAHALRFSNHPLVSNCAAETLRLFNYACKRMPKAM